MTRWHSSRLLFLVSVLILHISVQVSTAIPAAATAAAADQLNSIPLFPGVASSKNSQTIASGNGKGKGGWSDDFDPDSFSPDDPKSTTANSPSAAAQNPESAAAPSPSTATTSTTTTENTTATTTTGKTTATSTTNSNAASRATPAPAPTPLVCPQGQVQVSVESAGVFCVHGPRICSGSMNDGNCPGPDKGNGLPEGSYCGIVGSGVYGCKRNPTPTG